MSGHSHWAGIKHKKALVDAKRGKLWSRLAKAIIVAAKTGGGDPDMNLRLRYAIDDAKAVSMPKDNIQRAIKRGTGELEGGNLDEVTYEGYGAGGVAVLCEVLTDNRNRTAGDVRNAFAKHGGVLGETNSVSFLFSRLGVVRYPASAASEDAMLEAAIEAGAENVDSDAEGHEVTTTPESFFAVRDALEGRFGAPEEAKVDWRPTTLVTLNEERAVSVLKLLDALDDNDDVQNVYANCDIPDAVMAKLSA